MGNRLRTVLQVAKEELDLDIYLNPDLGDKSPKYLGDGTNVIAVIAPNGYIEGINDESAASLSANKDLSYQSLEDAGKPYPPYYIISHTEDINDLCISLNIANQFAHSVGYPVIIKTNQGSHSIGVKLVHNETEFFNHIVNLFKSNNKIIIQKYIPGPEFRVVLFKDNVVIAYEKISDEAIKNYQSSFYQEVEYIGPEMEQFLIETQIALNLDYCAIDIKTPNLSDLDFNRTYILELNCHPGIHFMLEEKGVDFVRELYKKLILDVISRCKIN